MDFIYVASVVLLFALTVGIAIGCARLGGGE